MIDYKYQVGGSLTVNAPSYVRRQADYLLYEALKQGEFCYILNSRQMGKSSLLASTKHRLEQEGFKCSTIDMSIIGTSHITPLQWYKSVVGDLWLGFNLLNKINLKSWWREQEDISLLERLRWFIEELLQLHFPDKRLFIFVDEIDSILSLNFSVDDFFALIRFCYNQRAINPEYQRITFAIFGVATPLDLIQDKRRTPFNIGKSIEIQGFKLQETIPLTKGLQGKVVNPKLILKEILVWTGGQPFLTQKLCQIVANEKCKDKDKLLINNSQLFIASLVRSHIINNWEFQDEPEHLRTISSRLLENEQTAGRLLGFYQQILMGEDVTIYDIREKNELILSGLVITSQGKIKIKNKIYQTIFNLDWVATKLENLRPYSQNIKKWLASNQQDKSQLLKGITLKEAVAWSENKKLSNIDYHFLANSQQLDKQEIEINLNAEKIELEKAQFTLTAAREANRILNQARKAAKLNAVLHFSKPCIVSFAIGITSFIILLRFIGLLQGMEWNMYDSFLQQRPQAGIDSRVVVITIDEPDLQKIGQYPIPDNILVKALNKLKTYQPKVIGLDLYRDLPVEPGYQELVEFFKATPNLIGIDKVVGTKVAPPRVLAQLSQVGFSDQVLDGDGKVRRALLTVRSPYSPAGILRRTLAQLDTLYETLRERGLATLWVRQFATDGNRQDCDCLTAARSPKNQLRQSLGLQLALQYLKTVGITPYPHPQNRHYIQLGKALIIPLQPFDGGYVWADTGGYQILLSYHGTEQNFQSFSITDLLQERIPKEKIQNRVVLIGATAESINDLFQTPYNNRLFGSSKQMAGVFIHANITSQILTAALQGRGMLQTWSEIWESLWILLWSGIGTLIAWRLKSPKQLMFVVTSTGLGLIVFSYLAFLQGWWIPIIPSLLGLILAPIILPMFATKQLEKIQLQQTLKLLLAVAKEQPAAGKIAIEYFKQAEGKENQQLIDKILQQDD
ncbi:CHASE2 domain-containing protein [Nostoc sp. LPT]|uniref:CHASE2 domain-containing protein n=1 Tax=Nostoc sp. LPT TaxID=2815387 RepID=UPI001DF23EB3|nr:CHASE2 domain-containing protein [Nostoc sp. LPT]MBN4005114.1 CHASE2 domain-containing protein [Nostoc sp. LPT]